ncbi:MAG: NADH-ubiquinone oxidoreductase-F iron-sulfur binding region domain-containing protein [Thermoleophilia bacterium]
MKASGVAGVAAAFQEIHGVAEQAYRDLQETQAVVMVGAATCGRATGALDVLRTFRSEVKKHDLECSVIEVGCMGHCYAEPVVVIAKPGLPRIVYQKVDPALAKKLVADFIMGDDPCLGSALGALEATDLLANLDDAPRARYEKKVILQNSGYIDPEDVHQYVATGGYSALAKALETEPGQIVEEMKRSGLRGRGGAGFATGEKWSICRQAEGDSKYVICNGDEGDPGAFMDRAILESDPHSVVEGMLIAAYAVGADQGYIYVRAEYPLAVQRTRTALRQARRLNLLGKNILGSDFSFDIRVFEGSGAFVCGEETALIASIEGRAGTPSHRPPYPAVSGLNGKPTLINNVKTVALVRHIVDKGAEWFSGIGTPDSPGTAVFALAGKVANTGLVEVPMGTTLRQVIYDIGGGIPDGKRFKAVQIGGPSGGCLPEMALDLPIDFESLTEAGAMMGSGGMIVLDEDDCMVEIARYFLQFTQHESCGKCTFCRLGTKQMLETLGDFTKGIGQLEDIDTLIELAEDIKAGSLCGLGRTAPNPVLTNLRYFRDEYEAHIEEGSCPAHMCQDLIAYYVLSDDCEPCCDICVKHCPVEAITRNKKKKVAVIDQEKCTKCGTCLPSCPNVYRAIVRVSPCTEVPN